MEEMKKYEIKKPPEKLVVHDGKYLHPYPKKEKNPHIEDEGKTNERKIHEP